MGIVWRMRTNYVALTVVVACMAALGLLTGFVQRSVTSITTTFASAPRALDVRFLLRSSPAENKVPPLAGECSQVFVARAAFLTK
jgi:hypothetical protein